MARPYPPERLCEKTFCMDCQTAIRHYGTVQWLAHGTVLNHHEKAKMIQLPDIRIHGAATPMRRAVALVAMAFALAGSVPALADRNAGGQVGDATDALESFHPRLAPADAPLSRAMPVLARRNSQELAERPNRSSPRILSTPAVGRGELEAIEKHDALTARTVSAREDGARTRAGAARWPASEPAISERRPAIRLAQAIDESPAARALREARELLATLGYSPGPAQGNWNKDTSRAYGEFLRKEGLPVTTGLTLAGLRALREAAKRRAAANRAPSPATTAVEKAPSPAKSMPRTLVQAVVDRDIGAIQAALRAGKNLNARDKRGWTALMHAAGNGYGILVPAFLAAGVDPDIRAPDGATALFISVLKGHEDIAAVLVRAGADISVRGPGNRTALDLARARKLGAAVSTLEAAATDREQFLTARKLNSAEGYEKYLTSNPDGIYVEEAGVLRDEARDNEAFAQARSKDTARAYLAYLEAYPDGKNRPSAERRIAELDRDGFERANAAGTARAYRQYLYDNPTGRHRTEARKRLVQINRETRRVVKWTYAMRGPGYEHTNVVIERGSEVRIRERRGDWYRIDGQNDAAVFIRAENLAAGPGEPRCTDVAQGAPCWMTVANLPGCYAWNAGLRPGETVSWSGQCIDGRLFGKGELTRKYPGSDSQWVTSIETGEMVGGREYGRWMRRTSDGSSTEGVYVDGRKHGAWVEVRTERQAQTHTSTSTEGAYVDGKKHGAWVEVRTEQQAQTHTSKGTYANGLKHGPWTHDDSRASETGSYVNDAKHGTWITRWPGGSRHDQEYRRGFHEGLPGVFVSSDGERLSGTMRGICFLDADGRKWWIFGGNKDECLVD